MLAMSGVLKLCFNNRVEVSFLDRCGRGGERQRGFYVGWVRQDGQGTKPPLPYTPPEKKSAVLASKALRHVPVCRRFREPALICLSKLPILLFYLGGNLCGQPAPLRAQPLHPPTEMSCKATVDSWQPRRRSDERPDRDQRVRSNEPFTWSFFWPGVLVVIFILGLYLRKSISRLYWSTRASIRERR